MSQAFYLVAQCPKCDEEIVYGQCVTFMEHQGLPLIPYDLAAQTVFECDHCGARAYSGDFELLTEDQV